MTHFDGNLVLFLISSSFGLSGYPAGYLTTKLSIYSTLTVGTGLFVLSYLCIFIGAKYEYGFFLVGFVGIASAAMIVQMSLLFGCLRHFRSNRGMVSGALFGIAYGAPALLHVWEIMYVNPLDIPPIQLLGYFGSEEEFYDTNEVLDNCSNFFWLLFAASLPLLAAPIIVFRLHPPPLPTDNSHDLEIKWSCLNKLCTVCFDSRFIMTFISFGFGCVAGLCARSTLKTYGDSFISNGHYLSKIGGIGSFASAVGALSMGVILDISPHICAKLVLLSTLINFVGTVMLMCAPSLGQIGFMFSYGLTLYAFGGFTSVLTLILLDMFPMSDFPVAFGIASLVSFFSAVWYSIASFSRLPWNEFWLANTMFAFLAVGSAIGLLLKTDLLQDTEDGIVGSCPAHPLSDREEETEEEFVFSEGRRNTRRYIRYLER